MSYLLPLKRVAETNMGQSPPSSECNREGTGIPFLQGNSEFGKLNPVEVQFCQDPPKFCGNGDFLLSVRAPVGALNVADKKYGIGRGLCAISPLYDRCDARYFWYLLHFCREELRSVSTGSVYEAVSQEQVGNVKVLMHSLHVQRTIANFLDQKIAAIDALIDKKERLIELLAEKRGAIIHQAVTKGLDPGVAMKDSGVEWIGEIPAHWQIKRLKFSCQLETGHTPSRSEPLNWVEEECLIPWVSLNDTKKLRVCDYISDTFYKISKRGMANSSAHLIESGAVVFTRDATVGLAAITTQPAAVSQHIVAWLPRVGIESLFLLRAINAMKGELERLTFGATIKTIGMGDIKELVTPVPPSEEQISISDFLKEEIGVIDEVDVCLARQICMIREYRQALITAAVTGQLDIPETP